jgi:hypothetical protein
MSTAKGADYRGKKSTTVSGKTCQAWAVSAHKEKEESFRGETLEGAQNFCRNPDPLWTSTWCYTTDPSKNWEVCDILPTCPLGKLLAPVYHIWWGMPWPSLYSNLLRHQYCFCPLWIDLKRPPFSFCRHQSCSTFTTLNERYCIYSSDVTLLEKKVHMCSKIIWSHADNRQTLNCNVDCPQWDYNIELALHMLHARCRESDLITYKSNHKAVLCECIILVAMALVFYSPCTYIAC